MCTHRFDIPKPRDRRGSPSTQGRKHSGGYRKKRRGTVVNPWGLDVEIPVWGIYNDNISDRDRLLLLKLDFEPPIMPPGQPDTVINHGIKKKIRPSSASGKVQSHPSYYSSLFGGRPTTAAAGIRTPDPTQPQRPTTQATSGQRSSWKAQEETDEEIRRAKQPRRLTLGAVDGISEMDNLPRPGMGFGSVGAQLKSKVNINNVSDGRLFTFLFTGETKTRVLYTGVLFIHEPFTYMITTVY